MNIQQKICLCVYVSLVTMVTATRDEHLRQKRTCVTVNTKVNQPSYFTLNGTNLATNRRMVQIRTEESQECWLNLTSIVDSFNFTDATVVGYFDFVCVEPLKLYFDFYDNPKKLSVIQYIKIKNCRISVTDINAIASVGVTRVLIFINSTFEPKKNARQQPNCSNLHGLSSLAVVNDGKTDMPNLNNFLNCAPVFEKLAEVILSGMELSTLPDTLETKLPNLQAMDIPNNNFTLPPLLFPWTKSVYNLPDGIARSNFMQNHYVDSLYLDIPEEIFRRTYRLDNNMIRNISDVSFQGLIHYFSMQRNRLIELGEDTFSNVTGLQYISLAENDLETIPCSAFSALNELSNLDLSKNRLKSLCANTFHHLFEMKHLNLANNSLESLSQGIFKDLKKLVLLHLEYNKLKTVSPMSFPLRSVNFKEIHLSNNPIEQLPEFVFWIRSLRQIDLHHTNISLGNFTQFLETMDERRVQESTTTSLSYYNYKETASQSKENLRILDISHAKIKGLNLATNLSSELFYRLKLLLLNFKFIFTGNPLSCECDILPVSRFINELAVKESIGMDRFTSWLCTRPRELEGRSLTDISPEETYCSIEDSNCPTECQCFKREVNDHIIVDCRDRNLSTIHEVLPEGTLELWYSENLISKLTGNRNFLRAIILDVSHNQIDFIENTVADKLVNTKQLFLQSNLLASLPERFNRLSLNNLTLSSNPFSCDCHTLWMKDWLIRQIDTMNDVTQVSCFVKNEEGNVFIKVPDDHFVCDEIDKIDTLKHVVLSSVVSTFIAVMFLVLSVVIYAYRQECKVLIFVYTGWHPFDRDHAERQEHIDCIIVHSGEQTTWVMDNIVRLLENENLDYKVCDMARDFVVGLSFQENLTRMVKNSKRILFCLTQDWHLSSESFIISWNIAQEKIKETRSNFGIVITHEISCKEITDKDLLRFIKGKRNVDTKEKLFTKKLLYYMPSNNREATINKTKMAFDNQISVLELENDAMKHSSSYLYESEVNSETCHVFISYHDDDISYVTKDLQPLLEQYGFRLCIPDRDFIAGASKENNILNGIHSCLRTILVLSKAHLRDEWSLFTFRHAYEKSMRQKNNHLIVILLEDVENDVLDEEVRTYLSHYITLKVDDRWYEQKLFNTLPLLRNQEHLHTSPLFTFNNMKHDLENVILQF